MSGRRLTYKDRKHLNTGMTFSTSDRSSGRHGLNPLQFCPKCNFSCRMDEEFKAHYKASHVAKVGQ